VFNSGWYQFFPQFALLHSATCVQLRLITILSSICAAPFSNMCSTQADKSSQKLRLRCGCQFPWCVLVLMRAKEPKRWLQSYTHKYCAGGKAAWWVYWTPQCKNSEHAPTEGSKTIASVTSTWKVNLIKHGRTSCYLTVFLCTGYSSLESIYNVDLLIKTTWCYTTIIWTLKLNGLDNRSGAYEVNRSYAHLTSTTDKIGHTVEERGSVWRHSWWRNHHRWGT
jgi:hypothetical protein